MIRKPCKSWGLCLVSIALALGLAGCATSGTAVPAIVDRPPSAPLVRLTLTRVDDRSVNATLAMPAGARQVVVDARNQIDQTHTTPALDPAHPSFVLRSPWNGEVRVNDGTASTFFSIVVQPVLPSPPHAPSIVYGPQGRVVVRFNDDGRAPAGSHIIITSPAISTPINPAGLIGEPVEIALVPPAQGPTPVVVGLTPWLPPVNATLAIHVFDRTTQTWSALHSHVSRDGTVYANAPIPGVFAVKVTP